MGFYVEVKDDDNNVIRDISKNYPGQIEVEEQREDSVLCLTAEKNTLSTGYHKSFNN